MSRARARNSSHPAADCRTERSLCTHCSAFGQPIPHANLFRNDFHLNWCWQYNIVHFCAICFPFTRLGPRNRPRSPEASPPPAPANMNAECTFCPHSRPPRATFTHFASYLTPPNHSTTFFDAMLWVFPLLNQGNILFGRFFLFRHPVRLMW